MAETLAWPLCLRVSVVMAAKKRASLLFIPFPSGNFFGESRAITHPINKHSLTCQAPSVRRTGYAMSAAGNLAVVVFKQPLEPRLDTVLHFSHLAVTATLAQQKSWVISLQGGTTPFAQRCKCSEGHTWRLDGISSPCVECPHGLQLAPFHCLGRGVLLAPLLLPTAPSLYPFTTHAGSCHSPLHIYSLSKPSSSKLHVQWYFPFSTKMKDTVIVTCSEEACFTKKMVQTGHPWGNQSESRRALSLCLVGCQSQHFAQAQVAQLRARQGHSLNISQNRVKLNPTVFVGMTWGKWPNTDRIKNKAYHILFDYSRKVNNS